MIAIFQHLPIYCLQATKRIPRSCFYIVSVWVTHLLCVGMRISRCSYTFNLPNLKPKHVLQSGSIKIICVKFKTYFPHGCHWNHMKTRHHQCIINSDKNRTEYSVTSWYIISCATRKGRTAHWFWNNFHDPPGFFPEFFSSNCNLYAIMTSLHQIST